MLVGPSADVANGNTVIDGLLEAGDFRWIAPADGPSASALLALESNHDYPVLITSGDHALLSAATIDRFCAAAREVSADFIVGLVPYAMVRAAYPETRRTVLRFQDGAYCGSNLYLVKNLHGHAAVQLWSSFEVARKTPWRIARRLGIPMLVRYLCRRLPLTAAFERLSEMSTCTVRCTVLDDPEAAVDVDSADDWRLAERIVSNAEAQAGHPKNARRAMSIAPASASCAPSGTFKGVIPASRPRPSSRARACPGSPIWKPRG